VKWRIGHRPQGRWLHVTLTVGKLYVNSSGRDVGRSNSPAETAGQFMSRQTKTFLMERFREMGISPATRHGQNFLIDLNLVQLLVDAAELGPEDVVLEVGTGTG